MIDVRRIQASLAREGIGAWLLYDFRGLNPIARDVLQTPSDAIITRRWFYCIPSEGEPVALQHAIEPDSVAHLPGRKIVFTNRNSLRDHLAATLQPFKTVAMEYSPHGALPTLSCVDRGTVEMIESLGPRVVSSANLVQDFLAVLTDSQYLSHRRAVAKILKIKDAAFDRAAEMVGSGLHLDEFSLQQFILERFQANRLVTEHSPIVAVNTHAGQPHFEPTERNHAPIREGDLLLIDLWAREPGGVFADITWTAYMGDSVPEDVDRIFQVVRRARDAVVEAIAESTRQGRTITGAEADRVARKIIADAGYGDRFLHRTGHSITSSLHGPGANLDDLETEDTRPLVPGLLFSVEPGIYLDEFGIRSELNVFMTSEGPQVTTLPLQTEVLPLLKR